MSALKNLSTDLIPTDCCVCGVWHAIPRTMYEHCLNHGGFWKCPNGHSIGWGKGSLEKELEKEKKRREWAEKNAENANIRANEAERRRIAQKAANTRLRNRAKAGICPCCNRHFKQLEAHMKNKHPDFQP